MSTLYLIRHGQASFGAENYDVLSSLGIEQSKELGRHFARVGQRLDAVYTGPLQRQLDTTEHMLAAAREAGTSYPEPVVVDGVSEYPAFELIKHWLPKLREQDEDIRALLESPNPSASTSPRFERVYHSIIDRWVTGELDTGGLESYGSFVERVEGVIRRIMSEHGRGSHVAVVTSGGPISLGVRHALELADLMAMKLAWVIANASVTEFRWRGDEITLVGFNRIPHLHERKLISYR